MASHMWEEWDAETKQRMADEMFVHGAARARLVARGLALLKGDDIRTDGGVLQVTIEPEGERDYVLQDAQNADDWPENELHEVVLDPTEITIEGTPEGIRWLYDWMEWAENEYRLEGGQYLADDCRELADIFWDALPEDPPERQRPRKLTDGGSLDYDIPRDHVVPREELEQTGDTEYGPTYRCPRCGYEWVTEYCDCPECLWAGMCQEGWE